ncbi:hypothetical protein Btru_059603 [Bulinus truncatus]|nr:hypothetical protein Btru_059603 [Bulinus truncatus]
MPRNNVQRTVPGTYQSTIQKIKVTNGPITEIVFIKSYIVQNIQVDEKWTRTGRLNTRERNKRRSPSRTEVMVSPDGTFYMTSSCTIQRLEINDMGKYSRPLWKSPQT